MSEPLYHEPDADSTAVTADPNSSMPSTPHGSPNRYTSVQAQLVEYQQPNGHCNAITMAGVQSRISTRWRSVSILARRVQTTQQTAAEAPSYWLARTQAGHAQFRHAIVATIKPTQACIRCRLVGSFRLQMLSAAHTYCRLQAYSLLQPDACAVQAKYPIKKHEQYSEHNENVI